jgi:hypothetical protein
MKYVRALEYVLQNAPVRAKDPEKKVSSIEYKVFFVIRIDVRGCF